MTRKERRKYDLYYRRKYGVGIDYYESKWKEQGRVCAICKKSRKLTQRRFALDHSHVSGKPRGILCFFCNKRRLGALNLEWARKIVEYLEKYDNESSL